MDEQTEKEKNEARKLFKVSDFLTPIISILVFVLLAIFLYIPMISSAVSNIEELDEIETKYEQVMSVQNGLNTLDVPSVQTDLNNSKTVIPTNLQVSDFIFYVDELAREKGLTFKEIFAGDIEVQGQEEADDFNGVSGPLKYSGTISQITEFMGELQESSPFLISADNIDLKKGPESWEIALTVTGYYIDRNNVSGAVNLYNPFIPYTRFEDVVKIFEDKASQL